MKINDIEKFLGKERFIFKTPRPNDEDFKKISSIFSEEPFPIFEESPYHILSYLKYDYEPIYVESDYFRGVLLVGEKELALFSPLIYDFDHFMSFVSKLKAISSVGEIRIQNVSSDWLSKKKNKLLSVKHRIEPRSMEEIVYDVSKIHPLKGARFSNLRNAKRKLIESGELIFKNIGEENIQDAFKVLKIWNKTQGHKYEKKKEEKENFTLKVFASFRKTVTGKNLLFQVGYLRGNPVSISLMHRSVLKEDWGIIYLIKGINKKEYQGTHGVSDATYIHSFDTAVSWGLHFLNDGELGHEPGTRKHKLAFEATMYLKSFDVFI